MKLANGIKQLVLSDGTQLFFYYANNAGRGTNNVTIYHVNSDIERAGCCKKQDKSEYLNVTTTSGWAGNVNFSKKVIDRLQLKNLAVSDNVQPLGSQQRFPTGYSLYV